MMDIEVEGKEVRFLVDTGAEVTVITERVARLLNRGVRRTEKKLFGAGGGALEVLGEVEIAMRKGDVSTRATAAVVRGANKSLLGQPEIAALGLIQMVRAIRVEEKYPGLYQSLGSLPDEFEIKLKEGATPFALPVPRRLPLV